MWLCLVQSQDFQDYIFQDLKKNHIYGEEVQE